MRQALGEEGMSHTWMFEWKNPSSPSPKMARLGKEESRASSTFSFTSRGLFIKHSSYQVKQSIPHTTVTFYGDCWKMGKDFALKFGDERTVCCITTEHSFALGNF
jgi:hypothetical protein